MMWRLWLSGAWGQIWLWQRGWYSWLLAALLLSLPFQGRSSLLHSADFNRAAAVAVPLVELCWLAVPLTPPTLAHFPGAGELCERGPDPLFLTATARELQLLGRRSAGGSLWDSCVRGWEQPALGGDKYASLQLKQFCGRTS